MRSFVLALAVVACGKADPKPAPPPAPGSAAVTAPSHDLAIFLGDQQVATVTTGDLAKWPRLDTLMPPDDRRLGRWDEIALVGATPQSIHSPSSTYPELVPAVFPAADGTASFGVFDPVELGKHGTPQVRTDRVTEVHVKVNQDQSRGQHEQGGGGGTDPSELKLGVKTPKGEQVIDGKTLLAIPRENVPGGEGQGWALTTLLKAAGVTDFQTLVLSDSNGLALNLDKTAFDPKTSIPFVKLNRSGQLRFRIYKKQGEGWTSSGDLRGLVAIEITK